MLSYPEFVHTVRAAISRFQQHWLNAEQEQAVSAALSPPTFIVAGPGAGKTTVLVLRILKLLLVDQLAADGIIATTFTRKAAGELRSRILSWGYATLSQAIQQAQQAGNGQRAHWLRSIDVNAVTVGTLDSLSEQFLVDCRGPGEITPATIESFLTRGLIRRHALFAQTRFRDMQLENHLNALAPHFPQARALADKVKVVQAFADRVRHDGMNLAAYAATGPGQQVLCAAVHDYFTFLAHNHLADYARLEQLILQRLGAGQLAPVTDRLRALLVDEFQDTNYLQEQIYLELCRRSNASLTVVGDDDQSIYRFRGATVEIFANFQTRIVQALGQAWQPHRMDLYCNYRSTRRIVDFCQHFMQLDPTFQAARAPGKLPLAAHAAHAAIPASNIPILGMFRTSPQVLADDLTQLLWDVFQGPGRGIPCANGPFTVMRAPGGDLGDSVLLAHSVRERTTNGRDRLPLFMRQALQHRGIRVFNPRGRSLGDIPEVQHLLGLALECIDPHATVLNAIPPTSMAQGVRASLNAWRQSALQFMATDPAPGGLAAFVHGWRTRTPTNMQQWPQTWPLLELIFTLTTWLPFLHSDPEGQVYLEAVTRTVAEVGQMASYRAQILYGTGGPHDANSIREAIRAVFESIATSSIDIDEEIMPHVPRSYFPIMTVHQAKGLEFPLVIVDVGSDYQRNHHTQRRFRFPVEGDDVHVMEEAVAACSPIGGLRMQRVAVERAWDDLRRLYFVAYSRPENVLLLVGLVAQIQQLTPVPCLAVGDRRGGARGLTFVPAHQWTPTHGAGTVALI